MIISKFIISARSTIRQAIKKMDENGRGFVAIEDGRKVCGIITDGDTRRAILHGMDLEHSVKTIMTKEFISIGENTKDEDVEDIFLNGRKKHIPVLKNGRLVDVIFAEEFFRNRNHPLYVPQKVNFPVVVMAGGKGMRLDPFTRILPKPLIPIGEKAVIEIIMDNLAGQGIKHFYISVNHKAKMVRAYFEDVSCPYRISFIEEDEPLGTAGSLKMIEHKVKTPFFVFNCDTIIEEDLVKVHDFHNNGNYDLTLVGVMQKHVVPYGVCEVSQDGCLKKINEKPSFDFLINTGVYLMNPRVLKLISSGEKMDMPELIGKIMKKKHKVGVYPISERSWIDIGQWEGYKKTIAKLKV